MAEAGLPDYELSFWYGLFVPAGTPGGVVARVFDAAQVALQRPEVKEMLAREGTEAAGSRSPEEFAAFLAEDAKLWARLVKESGAKID
jgi:tripartite-type tricarboxylate transporter receptor subunit TctC